MSPFGPEGGLQGIPEPTFGQVLLASFQGIVTEVDTGR